MKLKQLKLKNFGSFVNFQCEFNDQVTNLVGVNGSGKTTIGLTAIWACFKGIAERNAGGQLPGDRIHFIGGAGKSSDIELTLVDESRGKAKIKVRNHITAATNAISFEAPKGYPMDEGWLSRLLNVALLSAKNFCSLSGRDQALLLGIDVSDLDKQLKALKDELAGLNRDRKQIGEVVEVPPAERVSVSDLLNQKQSIDDFNTIQKKRADDIVDAKDLIREDEEDIARIEAELEEAKVRLMNAKDALGALTKPEPPQSTEAVMASILGAEETNRKADAYQQFKQKKAMATAKDAEITESQAKQAEIQKQRLARITAHKFPFSGLTVDDDGGLLLNGRPINQNTFSKAELELIVARLHSSLNPEFKVRFIDDFESLDEDNQQKFVDELLAEGYQIITAEPGKKAVKPNTILLKECKVVESYETEPKRELL
jgi:DNA repair exonuclease SbcCD ATPase subunit